MPVQCQLSCVWVFVNLCSIAHQGPLPMGFSRQEYWCGLPVHSPGDLPDLGVEPESLTSPAPAGGFFPAISNYLATWCEELTPWKRPWCWERLRAGGEGDDRGWDGWMASLTRWTWVWVDSGSWWWEAWCAAVHGVTKSRTRLSDWTELNWIGYGKILKEQTRQFLIEKTQTILRILIRGYLIHKIDYMGDGENKKSHRGCWKKLKMRDSKI